MKKVTVGITQGDHNGVGPEVVLKALADETILELFTPVLFADSGIVKRAIKAFGLEMPRINFMQTASEATEGAINVVDLRLPDATVEPGVPTAVSGAGAVASLKSAMQALKEGDVDVMVTAPICKEAVQCDEFRFSGHTEWLGSEAGADCSPQMILFDDRLRVALVTTHLPLSEVPAAVTGERVAKAAYDFARTLKEDFNIVRPKVAVLSLNPHCGDGGLLGGEEKEKIAPAIEACMDKGILVFGPFAADGFFGSGSYRNFDGVLAMYHDQGLAPFKTIAAAHGVNFTAGLPWVRTSPDHGTAYDIAWKGEADPASMREAIYKAIDIFRNRMAYKASAADPLKRQMPERQSKGPRQDRQVKSALPRRESENLPRRDAENQTRRENENQKDTAAAPLGGQPAGQKEEES